MSRRMDRVDEACKEVLSEILQRETKDPRVGFVTVTEVKVTPDLRHARVYVSVLGSEEEAEKSLEGLESARGYLRARLGARLRLKYLPEIEFSRDRAAEQAVHLTEVMEKARHERVERREDELDR